MTISIHDCSMVREVIDGHRQILLYTSEEFIQHFLDSNKDAPYNYFASADSAIILVLGQVHMYGVDWSLVLWCGKVGFVLSRYFVDLSFDPGTS